jgi:hypothetical protein
MRQGCDISNFTTLNQHSADFLHGYMDFVCIGLQDKIKARDFKAMIYGDGVEAPDFEYYEDLPGRNLDICEPGQWVWIDIELGCFQDANAVRMQGTLNTDAGLKTLIYCNETSLQPVFGDSTELADFGCELVYAAYVPPLPKNWTPFNGWTQWREWQCSSMGMRINKGQGGEDINCDLLVAK